MTGGDKGCLEAPEGVPEALTFKRGLGELVQGQRVCVWGSAASTGSSLSPSPGPQKERAETGSTEVLGNCGAGRKESEGPQGLGCAWLTAGTQDLSCK